MSLPTVTRQEKYLAYLNGDTSVILPKPVTNVDYYLYNLCMKGGTGGGGVTSWNDLTDKPFYDEEVVVLPEADYQFAFSEDLGAYMTMFDVSEQLVFGKKYIIQFDGVQYESIAEEVEGAPYLGNTVFMGGPDNGMPFLMTIVPGTFICFSMVEKATITVGVKGTISVPLDSRFIPANVYEPFAIDFASYGLPDVTQTNIVMVDHNAFSEMLKNTQKGIVKVRFNYTGRIEYSTDGYEDVQGKTIESFAIVNNYRTHPETGMIESFRLHVIYEAMIFYFKVESSSMSAIGKKMTLT